MCKWMTLLAILTVSAMSGCSGAHGAHRVQRNRRRRESCPSHRSRCCVPGEVRATAPNPSGRQQVRTIEDDPDADGIANYRVIITDTFDAAGNMVSTLREEDFEADGIIDSRVMTSFAE